MVEFSLGFHRFFSSGFHRFLRWTLVEAAVLSSFTFIFSSFSASVLFHLLPNFHFFKFFSFYSTSPFPPNQFRLLVRRGSVQWGWESWSISHVFNKKGEAAYQKKDWGWLDSSSCFHRGLWKSFVKKLNFCFINIVIKTITIPLLLLIIIINAIMQMIVMIFPPAPFVAKFHAGPGSPQPSPLLALILIKISIKIFIKFWSWFWWRWWWWWSPALTIVRAYPDQKNYHHCWRLSWSRFVIIIVGALPDTDDYDWVDYNDWFSYLHFFDVDDDGDDSDNGEDDDYMMRMMMMMTMVRMVRKASVPCQQPHCLRWSRCWCKGYQDVNMNWHFDDDDEDYDDHDWWRWWYHLAWYCVAPCRSVR